MEYFAVVAVGRNFEGAVLLPEKFETYDAAENYTKKIRDDFHHSVIKRDAYIKGYLDSMNIPDVKFGDNVVKQEDFKTNLVEHLKANSKSNCNLDGFNPPSVMDYHEYFVLNVTSLVKKSNSLDLDSEELHLCEEGLKALMSQSILRMYRDFHFEETCKNLIKKLKVEKLRLS